ncbi:hypothetical protein ABZ281_39655, partial [Streptomyces sp. NPDC006265]|uniref:hypothetical protein n=1 Tax=Streptomyces sp. NPDC006265 TaxID=3156740 RepID=UPI0033AC0CEA
MGQQRRQRDAGQGGEQERTAEHERDGVSLHQQGREYIGTSEAIVGAVTDSLAAPRTLLLDGMTRKVASSETGPGQLQWLPAAGGIRGRA